MADDVKIPVSANLKGVTDELDRLPKKIEDTVRRVEKFKWHPFDLKQIEADLKKLEQMMLETHRRVQQSGGGGFVLPASPGMPVPAFPAAPVPAPPGRYPVPAPRQPHRGGGRGAYTHAPTWGTIPQQFIGGVGGGFSTIGSYAARGAIAGSYGGGGLAGGLRGLAGGLGIGALAFGAYKVGQSVSEGYDLAKERSGTLDTLKRQLGDVGISFEHLKAISDQTAQGLQINSKEAAELAAQFNRLSRGAYGVDGLSGATRNAIGFSRAYGLDPSAGVGFFGAMANMDRRQNNRELALLLAEAINRSGMSARADEVMQAMLGYASSVSRMVMGTGGLQGYAGAYSSLMGMRGMTSDNAAGILGAANASVMRMGGAGEAGMNFTMMALSRYGSLNPVQAAALAEGGLFGTRGDVFGPNSSISKFMGGAGMPGGDMNVSNFTAIRGALRGLGGNKWLQLDAAKRYFGVGSLSQAAALMNLDEGGAGNLMRAVQSAGIDINKLNSSGIQALAAAGPNATPEQLRNLASSNRQETEFTKMQDQLKALDDIKINTGDKLIGPINDIRGYVAAIAGKIAPGNAVDAERAKAAADMAAPFSSRKAQLENALAGELSVTSSHFNMMTPAQQDSVRQRRASAQAQLSKINTLANKEEKYKLPKGLLYGVWGAESSYGQDPNAFTPNSVGALGDFQIVPSTAARFGVKYGDFASEADGAARYLQELINKHGGDVKAALFEYNGVVHNIAAGDAYVSKVAKGAASMPESTPLPAGHSSTGSTGDFARMDRELSINGTFTLNDAKGNPIAAPLKTRVSVPRGAGAG